MNVIIKKAPAMETRAKLKRRVADIASKIRCVEVQAKGSRPGKRRSALKPSKN